MTDLRLRNVKTGVVCRELTHADQDAAIALLTQGFAAQRRRAFWVRAFDRLARRAPPEGAPRFGFGLEADGALVGVLLLIVSDVVQGGAAIRRINVSSFYVQDGYRPFGSLLVNRALRSRETSVVNVTPAPETWALLHAQGYRPFASGRAVAIPLLAWSSREAQPAWSSREARPAWPPRGERLPGSVRWLRDPAAAAGLPEHQRRLVQDHLEWGCLAALCQTEQGPVPFVFGRRLRRGLPLAYLLYTPSLEALVAQARPLGRFLLRHGLVVLVVDGDARLPGMPGWFQAGHPKFARGLPPPPGDLAYTERAVFGV